MCQIVERLQELCDKYDIEMPERPFDLKAYDFGFDRYEVLDLTQELYDSYCDARNLDEN